VSCLAAAPILISQCSDSKSATEHTWCTKWGYVSAGVLVAPLGGVTMSLHKLSAGHGYDYLIRQGASTGCCPISGRQQPSWLTGSLQQGWTSETKFSAPHCRGDGAGVGRYSNDLARRRIGGCDQSRESASDLVQQFRHGGHLGLLFPSDVLRERDGIRVLT
jgi:hypothetical protein